MNLKLPKRTSQLDADREVLLGHATDGSPIHTTAGAHLLTGSENDELTHNLAAQRHLAAVQKAADTIQQGAATFIMHSIVEQAPDGLNTEADFARWLVASGWSYKQDGLTSRLLHRGTEMASMTGHCDPLLRSDVLRELKRRYKAAQ